MGLGYAARRLQRNFARQVGHQFLDDVARHLISGRPGCAFGDLLDATEERVAKALDQLLAGVVPASPSSDSACSFCPEITCPQRRG